MSRFKNYILYAAVLATVGIQPSMADSLTENMFERKVFLEEFTTENCNNCPAASVKLHNILELPEYEGRLIAVCHHVGFETDWLALRSAVACQCQGLGLSKRRRQGVCNCGR